MTSKKQGLSKRTGVIIGVAAAACVAAAAFAGAQGAIQLPGLSTERGLQLTQASTAPIFQPPPGAPLSFADIFERVSPAVVSIEVTAEVEVNSALQFLPGLPFQIPPDVAPQTEEAQAEASGFFISSDGYIVTNHHVIAEATEIMVTMSDDRKLEATVIGSDEETDLAVIKVEGQNFPFVNFENSAIPRVGDWVISIGNPFGLGGTATAGIVSAYNRVIPNDTTSNYVDFLQIDAAINRGNSGGPTFDVYGRVIGVNSAIYSPNSSGGSVGIGFAVPAHLADQITRDLIAEGRITRGFLGAGVQPYTEELAASMGMDYPPGTGGAFVGEITPGGPAEQAGMQLGDVILSLNGQKVADATGLIRLIGATRAGDTLRLEVLRAGRVITVNARSGVRPSQRELAGGEAPAAGRGGGRGPAPAPDQQVEGPSILGARLAPLNDALRQQFQIPSDVNGALITSIEAPLADSGLRRGDVIVRTALGPVATPQQFLAAVEAQRAAGRDTLLIFVVRGDSAPRAVIIDLEDAD